MSVVGAAGDGLTIHVAGIAATRYQIVNVRTGAVVSGPTSTGITNTGTQRYQATATMPTSQGDYEIQWDDGTGAWAASEDLTVQGNVSSPGVVQLKPPA